MFGLARTVSPRVDETIGFASACWIAVRRIYVEAGWSANAK